MITTLALGVVPKGEQTADTPKVEDEKSETSQETDDSTTEEDTS